MKIAGHHTLPIDRERAYWLLQDPDVLAPCMPGCEELVKTGDDAYRMKMNMIIAAITGRFSGTIQIADKNPCQSFRLIVEGAGKVGFMKGDGVLHLAPNGDGAEVRFEGDVQVGGTLAAVGQRLIDTTAKMLIKRFFEKLIARAANGSPSS